MQKKYFESEIYKRNDELVTKKVKNAKVVILGLGGLGSNIASMLARVGVGNLKLVDFDKVELSNLNRQFYNKTHIGLFKTDALKSELKLINPYLNFEILNLKITSQNLNFVLKDDFLICEAFDNADLKALLMDYASKNLDKYFVFGSGMGGYESSNSMKVKKFGTNCYICGDFSSKASLMAPKVVQCASMQANTILRIIMNEFEI